jgi:hypothetical protein
MHELTTMSQEDRYPTSRDRFHARWGVIAAVVAAVAGAVVGSGVTHLVSREVPDAKLLEVRQDLERERARAYNLDLRLKKFENPEVRRVKAKASMSLPRHPDGAPPSGSKSVPMQASLEQPKSSMSSGASEKSDDTTPTPTEKPGPIATTAFGLNFSEPLCVHTSASSIRCSLFIINTERDKALRLYVRDDYVTGTFTQIIDGKGNTYQARKISLANQDGSSVDSTLVSELPTRVVISFEGLSEPVDSIARMNLGGIVEGQYFVARFRKITVSR